MTSATSFSIVGIIITVAVLTLLTALFVQVKRKQGTKWAVCSVLGVLVCLFLAGAIWDAASYNIDKVELKGEESSTYSPDELEEAYAVLKTDSFLARDGYKLRSAKYVGDIQCEEQLAYVQELNPDAEYLECIIIETSFKTPKDNEAAGGLEPGTVYSDYDWYLAHADGGPWEVVTSGYA